MNILDIAIVKQLAGGGGSGTDNYNDLSNLPKINGTTLSGDKSSSSLGLQSEIKEGAELASDLVDDSKSDNKFVTPAEKLEWSGKQNLIDTSHKLSSDLVDDTDKTNKFVTASEKETWNGKQNLIDNSHKLSSDLVDDTNQTHKFVTSTEKQTWNDKQNAIDSDHKLSSSLVSFSEAEAAALASGINSTKVEQIGTNQTNILYGLNMGVKNILPVAFESRTNYGVTCTNNGDGSITVNGTNSQSSGTIIIANVQSTVIDGYGDPRNFLGKNKNYVCIGNTTTANLRIQILGWNSSSDNSIIASSTTEGVSFNTGNWNYISVRIWVQASATFNNIVIKPMICTDAAWAQSTDYMPPALPNYDLTRLEAEDRASLAEVVDSGAKNLVDWRNTTSDGTGVTISDGTYTSNNGDSRTTLRFQATALTSNGTLIESFNGDGTIPTSNGVINIPFTLPSGTAKIRAGHNGSQRNARFDIPISNTSLEVGKSYVMQVNVTQYTDPSGIFKWKDLMICTKAAFGVSQKFVPFGNDPFYQVPINHNMIYRGRNLGASLTDAQHTALSSGNFTDLYLGDYWTKTVTIPAGTYTGGDDQEVTVPAQTNITLKAVIADFDTFYAGYASSYAGINTHHAAVIVTGFSNVVWNKTNSTAGGYVASLIHKWLVGSALPQIETWFGSAKVLSHQKLLTNAITGDAASGWAWSSQKISLLSENQMYGSKVWGNSKAANGGYEPGEAFKHLNVFNHIDANLLFGNKNIWLRDIASAVGAAHLYDYGDAHRADASNAGIAPAALILLS